MLVFTKCTSCQVEISFKTPAHTRVEFAMKHSKNIIIRCKKCNKKNSVHVDSLQAKRSKISLWVSLFIILGTLPILVFMLYPYFRLSKNIFVFLVLSGFISILVSAYLISNKQDEKKVRNFNKYRL